MMLDPSYSVPPDATDHLIRRVVVALFWVFSGGGLLWVTWSAWRDARASEGVDADQIRLIRNLYALLNELEAAGDGSELRGFQSEFEAAFGFAPGGIEEFNRKLGDMSASERARLWKIVGAQPRCETQARAPHGESR